MVSEKELSELHPIDRARVKHLSYQLKQKLSEYLENTKELIYRNRVLEELAKQLNPYNREVPLHPLHLEEIEKRRRQLISERNAYESKVQKLKEEIKELTDELKPYLTEKVKVDLKKLTKPLFLIIVSLSIAYLVFSNFQSYIGYSVLPELNLTRVIFGLIFLLILITISLKYLK